MKITNMKRSIWILLMVMALGLSAKSHPDKNFHIYLCLGQSNMEGNAPIE